MEYICSEKLGELDCFEVCAPKFTMQSLKFHEKEQIATYRHAVVLFCKDIEKIGSFVQQDQRSPTRNMQINKS